MMQSLCVGFGIDVPFDVKRASIIYISLGVGGPSDVDCVTKSVSKSVVKI